MATFFEVKRLICKLFGYNNIEDNENDVRILLQNRMGGEDIFFLDNNELKEIYNNIIVQDNRGLELFMNQQYEIPINIDRAMALRRYFPMPFCDNENGLEYAMGYCSINYCIYIINKWIDMEKSERKERAYIPFKMRRGIDGRFSIDDEKELDWKNALIHILRIFSIQIINQNDWDIEDARIKKTAYSFEFMYKTGIALIEYNDLHDVLSMKLYGPNFLNFEGLKNSNPPHREYMSDVIDYYRLALSSRDSYIRFLSFYHVIEYFYDEVFKRKIISDLREKLTHPDFSYKNDKKVYEIAQFTKHRMKMNEELGSGNELQSLIYVLQEFVNVEKLKFNLIQMNKDIITYYQDKRVSFCKAPAVQWNDSQGVYTNIAKRIYFVRNALVHSKSGKKEERYKPYKDEKELLREIPLIKTIAEMIIIGSSRII